MVLLKEGMNTTWYVKPGQNLANTKISDRKHALLVAGSSWKQFTGQLNRKKLQQEARDADNARRQYLKKGCEDMVSSWHLQKQKIEVETPEQVNQAHLERYFVIRKGQEKEREQHVQQVRKSIFVKSGDAKSLDGALLHAEVLYERALQKQYNDQLAEFQRLDELKHEEDAKEQDSKHIDTSLDEVKERVSKAAQHQREILMQIKENLEKRKAEKAEEYIRGCEDSRNIKRHMEEIASIKSNEEKKAKELAAKEYIAAKAKREAEKLQQLRENEEIDKIYEIYAASKCRIDQLRKEKEKEIIQKKIERTIIVQNQISTAAAEKEADEQRIIDKYNKEAEEREMRNLQLEKEKHQRQIREQEENLREMRAELDIQNYKDKEAEKWEILNRIKQQEAVRQFEEDSRVAKLEEEKLREVQLLKQIQERKEVEELEKQKQLIQDYADMKNLKKTDELFLAYGEECLKKAIDRGRSTYPIEVIIAKYKRDNNVGNPTPQWRCTNYVNRKTGASEKPFDKKVEEEKARTLQRRNAATNLLVNSRCNNSMNVHQRRCSCSCGKNAMVSNAKKIGSNNKPSASKPDVHKCEFCL